MIDDKEEYVVSHKIDNSIRYFLKKLDISALQCLKNFINGFSLFASKIKSKDLGALEDNKKFFLSFCISFQQLVQEKIIKDENGEDDHQ